MESTNDEESSDLISCDELDNSQQDQLSVQVSSLEKLVDYCAEEFSGDVTEPFLSNAVFMTHKWFISSEELLRKFMQRYSDHSLVNGEHIRKFKKSICSAVGSAEELRNRALSAEHPPLDQRKSSLAFKDLSAHTIAEQLTYLEYRMLRRIPFSEWKTYVCTGKLTNTSYLERYVALFNGVSRWVQAMVLNCVTPQERATCMEKFQQTAKPVLKPAQSPVHLNHYISTPPSKDIVQSGIQLKDLIALQVVLPDSVNGHLLNLQKMVRLSHIMSHLLLVQNTVPPVQPNSELIKMLRVSLQPRVTEEELYELSLAREPKNHTHSSCGSLGSVESNGEQGVMFADWAAGLLNTTPDPQTNERHVSSMVEAVFKIYDTNKDGSISVEEFDAIATNFPFIDSFGVLDINSDGVISRDEMKNYFMKANCHELSKGFSHNFQETTYFTPTFCDHCAGMLWGVIKQGYRCKGIDGKSLQKPEPLRITKWKNKMKLQKHLSEDSLKSVNGEFVNVPVDQYKKLLHVQQENEALVAENDRLQKDLEATTHKLNLLQNHLNSLRQNTVTFILDQMDALQMQKDTEV
ncbi:Ras guanyl-releasing protein 3 [Stylophora pistillata]|uniref:Ras guanyl-releasing protein 3 n=1 Tax=Stylophora pistillata TaxID=50429 RepID=A0A2B4RP60_STYPI|nr:Ras guanyl-releasing protein 3 [Stylophora pistillata]